jgi:hypothetical protein
MPKRIEGMLEARAAEAGLSVKEFLLTLGELEPGTPSLAELTERIRRETPRTTGVSSADVIRELRGPIPPVD